MRVEHLRAAGAQGYLVDVGEVRAMEPELTGELAGASFFPADLQCAPRAIARALAADLPRVHTGVEVQAIEVAHDAVTGVRTSAGVLPCAAAVIAAGPWSRPLAEAAGRRRSRSSRARASSCACAPRGRDERLIRHKVVEAGYLGSVASADAGLQVTSGARDDVGGRRARGLQPRAPRLRSRRRRRGEPRDARPGLRADARPGAR